MSYQEHFEPNCANRETQKWYHVRFGGFIGVAMNSYIYWDITHCYSLHDGLLLGLFFDPKKSGDISLRNFILLPKGLHCLISQKIYLSGNDIVCLR
jgi:hypothetical protein